ncbi:tetratricopeptide repeat protein [Lentilactobacillus kosonis]|uniref:TPR-repeat-containing protein n=1 Tax=Lentilactobacillus kosonis TaxID=2810561 RepID=A0A401FKY0_9LACO|nr:tetratricopeptide repeat protein [Lentilactobacillus kosonis]GAY73039.1 TPR-repeat-containing protein [Lentilactobacillus kosonis]
MNYSQTALDFLEKGQLDDFEKNYKLALKNDTDEYLFSLAEELYSYGFSDHSKEIYEQLLKKYPDDDTLKVNLAELAIDSDDDDKALEYLSFVSPESDEYVSSLMVSADLYQTQGLIETSEQKLLEAQMLAPEEPAIWLALAEFYFATRQFQKAIRYYLDLIKSGVTEMSAINLVERLGVAYAQTGKFEQAIGYLEQIKTINMNSDVKFELGFTYFSLNEYQKAIDVFEEIREDEPQYSSLYPYLADAYIEQNQVDKALITVQEGLANDQYNEQLWVKASEIAKQAGQMELVGEYLTKAHETAPDDLSILSRLSDWYVDNDKDDENIELLKPVADQEMFDAHLSYNLAISLNHKDDIKGATTNFQIAERELDTDTKF